MTRSADRAKGRPGSRVAGSRVPRSRPDDAGFQRIDQVALLAETFSPIPAAAPRVDLMRIVAAWTSAVGAHLSAVSCPCWYNRGRLVVDVKSVSWQRELVRHEPVILARLHDDPRLPRIATVVYRVRPTEVDADRAVRPASARMAGATSPVERRPPESEGAPGAGERGAALQDNLLAVMGKYLKRAASTSR